MSETKPPDYGVEEFLSSNLEETYTPSWYKLCNLPLHEETIEDRKEDGKTLSYVKGHYVTQTLNVLTNIAGIRHTFQAEFPELVVENKTKAGFGNEPDVPMICATAVCQGVLNLRFRNGDVISIGDIGHGSGMSKAAGLTSRAKAIESAQKEARTDALKRCCKDLGDAFGLVLYTGEPNPHRYTSATKKDCEDLYMELGQELGQKAMSSVRERLLAHLQTAAISSINSTIGVVYVHSCLTELKKRWLNHKWNKTQGVQYAGSATDEILAN